ncbi:MAG: ribosome assembly cofactor RimP [Bacteroidales bacterium]|nr:ribosome assembly cofactor RimP [Bacteroidales bacterium]
MIDKKEIIKLAEEYISGKDIFLVDVKVGTGNRISVLADKKGRITIDDCAALSRHIEGAMDRETEDFELQVSSPGLTSPFRVREQYDLNIGNKIEVTPVDGRKFKGILLSATAEGFEVETEKREKGLKKELVVIPFRYEDVKNVRIVISFKN